jgi:hypothetical protein
MSASEKRIRDAHVRKFVHLVALVGFIVTCLASMKGGAGFAAMTYRSALVMAVVSLTGRVIIRLMASYEEMNSGKG